MFFFKFFYKPFNYSCINIRPTKMCISIRSFNFYNTISTFKNRNVKCSTTKVINKYFHIRLFIKAISKCSCCWFVNNSFNFKAGNFSCIFCCLSLSFVKVCWNCNNCFSYRLSKISLCCFF